MNRITGTRRLLLAGATLAVLALTAACGGNGDDMAGMDHGNSASPKAGATFNNADVAFAQGMIPHHQQAVEMAALAETRAADPEIKKLAKEIKGAQDPEIKTMTGWLEQWGQPTEMPAGHQMPGMMSDEDLSKLKAAKGADFDRMFASMMIAHHKGAIEMAKDEQADGRNAKAKKLAATIEKTQTAETKQLQKILDRL